MRYLPANTENLWHIGLMSFLPLIHPGRPDSLKKRKLCWVGKIQKNEMHLRPEEGVDIVPSLGGLFDWIVDTTEML